MDPENKIHRHQSRIKREMYASRLNPFHSPPSSTGSHGTVSTTTTVDLTHDLSNFSLTPDGEGTRRLSEDLRSHSRRPVGRSGRFGPRPSTVVNTSALARTFPEWSSLASTLPTQEVEPAAVFDMECKENIPPPSEHTEFDQYLDLKRKRNVAEMQPRADTASDCSTVLSHGPGKASRRSRFALRTTKDAPVASGNPAQPSTSDLLVSKIRAAQASGDDRRSHSHPATPAQSARANPDSARQSLSPPMNKTDFSPTGRSFLLPPLHRHILDWTSGTLKFSTLRDGVPVFVKHGKAHSRFHQPTNEHAVVDAISIPEEDEEIFVSMDKLREEVKELQAHDEIVQQEAEHLQREVHQLQAELKRLKQRKVSDSAIGSDSEHSINRALDAQKNVYDEKIAQLQERLDQASRQVGVNDIHSAALTAERDEALHQAAMAREKIKRLQVELESCRKDVELAIKYRQDKESLEAENRSLEASNDTLRRQNEALTASNQSLTAQNATLRRDLDAAQRDLASVREELNSLRQECDDIKEERALIAQNHASLETHNETYFKENKGLRAKIASQEQRIRDLEKGIAGRDQMIDALQAEATRTTEGASQADHHTHFGNEVEKLRIRLHKQEADLLEKDGKIVDQEQMIAALRDENNRLEKEIESLQEEREEIEERWATDRRKNTRLGQVLQQRDARSSEHSNHRHMEHGRQEGRAKQKESRAGQGESTVSQRQEEGTAASMETLKQLAKELAVLILSETASRPAKVTRIVEPTKSVDDGYTASEESDESGALDVEDNLTKQLDLTHVFTQDEISNLKQTLNVLRQNQQQAVEEVSAGGNTVQTIDSDMPPLPRPILRRSKSEESVHQKQSKPAGILKKTHPAPYDDEFTGQLSVKSGASAVSLQSNESQKTARSHRSAASISVSEAARPKSRHHRRNLSDNAHLTTTERLGGELNMTSAFFVPDITLHSDQHLTQEPSGRSLGKGVRRTLDSICKHKSHNCTLCIRISAHAKKNTSISAESSMSRKTTVRVQKPIPVTERTKQHQDSDTEHEDEPTMRPSMPPGQALAIAIKEMEDEVEHLQIELMERNRMYCSLDKSVGQRERKKAMATIQAVQRRLEARSATIYRLHDVLEGQKLAGQVMTEEEVEVTIASLCGNEVTSESREMSWNGFD
ncbi:hypothetical protein VTK73DRAFT_6532 [Phialemonium thermophilum]|uniref:Cep57 centrosome microtubule-binding domain-containing protein n=1 Tax=Phialemonium thermophilum TaxID=223376 RepID=A0ABR3XWF6_9PEZI